MPPSTSVCIPVEISPHVGAAPRVFRLASHIGFDFLSLAQGLPDELGWLHDPLKIRFHLPGDPLAIECRGRAHEVVLDRDTENERAVRGLLQLIDLLPEAATRIETYVDERLAKA